MGIKTGFFSSYDGDRLYGANDLNSFLDGLVGEGVFKNYKNGLEVISSGTRHDQVTVLEGKTWFHNSYTIVDGGGITIEPSTFFPLNVKNFYVVVETGDDLKTRNNKIILTTEVDSTRHLPLAYIQRTEPYGEITKITDLRGSDACPWVVGLLANFTANEIIDQISNPTFAERLDQLVDIKYQETESRFNDLYNANDRKFKDLYNTNDQKFNTLYTEEKSKLDDLHDSNETRFNILYDSVSASAKAIVDEVLRQMPTVPLDLDLTDDNGDPITGMNGETTEEIQGLIHAVVRTGEENT